MVELLEINIEQFVDTILEKSFNNILEWFSVSIPGEICEPKKPCKYLAKFIDMRLQRSLKTPEIFRKEFPYRFRRKYF